MFIDSYTIHLIEKEPSFYKNIKRATSDKNVFRQYKSWWISVFFIVGIISLLFPENYSESKIISIIMQSVGILFFGFVIMIIPFVVFALVKKDIKGKMFMIIYSVCVLIAILFSILAHIKN